MLEEGTDHSLLADRKLICSTGKLFGFLAIWLYQIVEYPVQEYVRKLWKTDAFKLGSFTL